METQSLETKSVDNDDNQNTNSKEEDKICDDIVKQVFEREAYLNHEYYREFISRFNPCTRITPMKTIEEKFDDISSYLWSTCNPNYQYFQKSRKLNGFKMRKLFENFRDSAINDFGLPEMVSLPLGPKGTDISERKLNKAIEYRDAMRVFEGDDDTVVSYRNVDHNKSEAKLIYMYVEELIIKYNFKEQLKYERATSYYVGEYRSLEKIYHRIMGYTDERNELRKKNAVLYLEACLVPSEQEND
jgi:hypothetical protein